MNLQRLLVLTGLIVVTPYFLLNFFNHPSADDYWYASKVFETNQWQAQIDFYYQWSGRWLATFLLSVANPVVYRTPETYGLFSLANIVLLVSGLTFFSHRLCDFLGAKQHAINLSLAFVILCFSHFPSTNEGLYWFAGYINYTLPLSLSFFGLGLLLTAFERGHLTGVERLTLSVLIVLICGSNESMMLQVLCASGLAFLFQLYQKRKILGGSLLFALISSFCFLVMYLAPGNKVRAAHFEKPNPLVALLKSFGGVFEHIVQFMSLPFAFFLLVLVVANLRGSLPLNLSRVPGKAWHWFLALFVVMDIGFLPAYISMGGSPMGRVDNMFYVQYLFLMTLITLKWFEARREKVMAFFAPLSQLTTQRLIALGLASALLWDNNLRAWYDLMSSAPGYHQAMKQRHKKIQDSTQPIVYVDQIPNPPKSLVFSDLKKNSDNTYVSTYYGKQAIRLME